MTCRCARYLVGVSLFCVLFVSKIAAAEIHLTWNPNPETDIAGYKVYATDLASAAKSTFDVGLICEALFEPQAGRTYVFAVTAYNRAGLESAPSSQVRYDAPLDSLAVSWDPSIYATAANYRLSYGVLNSAAQQLAVGTNTSVQLSGLVRNLAYFLYVECFDANGQIIDSWQQINYLIPTDGPFGAVYIPRVNLAPQVQLTSPSTGSTASAPATILLSANASDPDSSIRSVDFYVGNSKVVSVPTSPYRSSWSTTSAGTYQISAVATDAYGVSTRSPAVTVTVSVPVPAAPTALAASATSDSVRLTWAHSGTDETGFRVYRASGGTFALVATLPANSIAYTNTALTAGTTYTYRVAAYNSGGNSPNAEISVTTQSLAPATPVNVSATALTSAIVVSWNASIGATQYVVERALSASGPFAVIGTSQITQWTDSAVTPGSLYFYRVTAGANGSSSAPSAIVSASLLSGAPAAPLSFTASVAKGQVKLAWKDNASNESSYVVERSLDGVSFNQIATLPINSASYTDTSAAARRKYYYRVGAANAAGVSFSNVLSVKTR
jgi:fibronectin type 3 domain-containing protein